ncbi:hypothetical protein FGIG_03467 [Fasciola gigantica]|uniref:MSP domain-containing protein n=1 Tax=Fasciola gigantica TaxID=46835 RepID=A0A504YLN6_FASGI|nr:hypothetical protein FGIG_03467 [Fasciola gigantica]
MALKNEIVIRPTEISFLKNTCQSFDPVEVLIANRSDKILRFKVFSTSRSKYTLSKCKGVLRSGESVRITFQVIRSQWNNENRRDFFKLQFVDHTNDELLASENSAQLALAAPGTSTRPCARSSIWHRIIALVRGFVFGTLLVICVAGISLPLWAAYARELFPRLRFWSAPRALESGLSCVFDTSDQFYSSPHPSCSAHCPLFQSHPSDSGNANVDEDEFARQSKIAIHSFRTAFLSIYGALIAVDPLTLLPNLSWFCLGLLIMFRWTRTGD